MSKEAAENIDRQLRAMETNFLHVLAEFQKEEGAIPKGWAEPPSDGGSGSGDDVLVMQLIVTRRLFDLLFLSMFHVADHGCEEGLSHLAKFGSTVTQALTQKAAEAGWFEEED